MPHRSRISARWHGLVAMAIAVVLWGAWTSGASVAMGERSPSSGVIAPDDGSPAVGDAALPGSAAIGLDAGPAAPIAPWLEPAVIEVPISRRPYRVVLSLHGDIQTPGIGDPSGSLEQTLLDALTDTAGALFETRLGPPCLYSVDPAAALAQLSSETCLRVVEPLDPSDKLYALTVSRHGNGFEVVGREFDVLTRELSPLARRTTSQAHDLPRTVAELIRSLFRPVAAYEQTPSGKLVTQVRGGDLTPADPSFVDWNASRTWQPFIRGYTAEGELATIVRIPWTLALTGELSEGRAATRVVSALKSPFAVRRSRNETVSLAAVSRGGGTTVRVVTRGAAKRPQAGLDVEVFAHDAFPNRSGEPTAEATTPGDAVAEPLPLQRGLTNSLGTVSIKALPEGAWCWVEVRSGQVMLARLPLLPGSLPEQAVELPDDRVRLQTEGELSTLQAQLADVVARRGMLGAAIRKGARTNDWKTVDPLLVDLAKLPGPAFFTRELTRIRVVATKRVRQARDRQAERRIQKLCDDVQDLIGKFLDEDKLIDLKQEVQDLRAIDTDRKAAESDIKKSP